MKPIKIFHLFIVLCFIAAISLPLLFVNKSAGKISTAENRALAKFPALFSTDGNMNPQFIKQFESWFNDSLGFRDGFVMLNTQLQYTVFSRLTKTDTMLGKDRWLFFVNSEVIKDYQQLNISDKQQIEQWGSSFEQVDQYLKGKNIPLITVLLPDKKTVYPENYPDTIFKVGNVSRTELLTNRLTANNKLDFVYAKDALVAAKQQAVVYSPRVDNAHWNTYGAFVGYLTLMERVQKYFPSLRGLSWADFEVVPYTREGKVYNAISFSETDYEFKLKYERKASQTQGVFDKLNLEHTTLCYSYTNPDKSLPKALIFGDSYYYLYLLPNLAESFSELIFIHNGNLKRMGSLVEKFKPDVVVLQSVERMFDYSMPRLVASMQENRDYEKYIRLPEVENLQAATKPTMWLDSSNNKPVQGKIKLDGDTKSIELSGWAIDLKENRTAGTLIVQVGDRYLTAAYGQARPSVADYFHNPQLVNSGFSVTIERSELENIEKISFIVVANNKSYRYKPVDFWLERQ